MKQNRPLELWEVIMFLANIGSQSVARPTRNAVTLPAPNTCVSTTTTNEHQPSPTKEQRAKKAFGNCVYSEIRVALRSPYKSLAVRLFDICCSVEEKRRERKESPCGHILQANWHNGPVLPEACLRTYVGAAKLSEATKPGRKAKTR